MIRQHAKLICLLAAVAIAFGYMGFQGQRLEAQDQANAKPTAVAVVNVAELISKCDKNKDFQAKVQKRDEAFVQERQKRQQAITDLRNDLDLVGTDEERQKKIREITKLSYEYQAWENIERQNLLRDQRMFLIELYGEIDAAVSAIAQREGYDLVIFDTPIPDFDTISPEQLIQVIGNRRVVYRKEDVSITKDVLEKLNFDYKNRG